MKFLGTVMFLFQKPSVDRLHDFLTAQSKFAFTYSAVGATAAVVFGSNQDWTSPRMVSAQKRV